MQVYIIIIGMVSINCYVGPFINVITRLMPTIIGIIIFIYFFMSYLLLLIKNQVLGKGSLWPTHNTMFK